MEFTAHEVARAKTMKAAGFSWRPRIGDWYVHHNGYCDFVRSFEQVEQIGLNGHVFLPTWSDCRGWLSRRGWGHPEVIDGGEGEVSMLVTHQDGALRRVTGISDLDCMYRIILQILLAQRV